MNSKNKLVYGWGINDVTYKVALHEKLGNKKRIWVCPYYDDWCGILERCFSLKCQDKCPTYKGTTIYEEWKYLTNFIKWVDSQPNKNWRHCVPDKDLLSGESKIYSPDTVVYIPNDLNVFITDRKNDRGLLMIGVCLVPSKNKPYYCSCSNPFKKKQEYLGRFKSELEAHLVWQAKKHEHACVLANMQDDSRVADVLRQRYSPDKDWTKR